jgi:hypothetical protein
MKRFVHREKGRNAAVHQMEGWFLQRSKACLPGRMAARSEATKYLLACSPGGTATNQPTRLATSTLQGGAILVAGRVQVWRCHNLQALLLLESASSVSDDTLARNLECKIAPMTPNRIRVVPCRRHDVDNRRHDVDNRLSLMPS